MVHLTCPANRELCSFSSNLRGKTAKLCLPIGKSLLTSTKLLNVDISGPQRVGFNEVTAWLDFVAHQHGEYTIGLDRVIDLYA